MEKTGLMWLARILLLLWLIIGSIILAKYYCGDKAEPQIIEETLVPEKVLGFSAEDGTFKTNADSYFRFPESNAVYEGASDKLRKSLSETAAYLKDNANKVLTITGYYTEDEGTPDLLPDYGFARANTIKKELEALGVQGSQLMTDGELADTGNFQDGYITNGITFTFSDKAVDDVDTKLERIRTEMVGTPLTVYFDTGDRTLNLGTEQKDKFADLIYFLDRVEGSSLQIGGYTDSRGDEKDNESLSRGRARFVRKNFTSGGISENRMSVEGYGEKNPIGDNRYKSGREKNRRVEVVLTEG